MEKIKRILIYIFSNAFLIKIILILLILTLFNGHFRVIHSGDVTLDTSHYGFDLNIKSNEKCQP